VTVTTDDGWLTHVCAPTEMGRLVAAFDWASTPLGAPSTWNAGLRAATSLCLTSRFPMLVVWGPELIQIYNDGYRPMLGDKHANALGRPAGEVWSEVWDVVGPMFESVITTAVPTWEECQSLIVDRHGYAEECFFQYSYSPIYDDDGTVGGVLDVVTETTAAVVAARRLRCLAALGASVSGDGDITDACARAVDTLGRWRPDITGAAIHLTIDGTLTTVASKREPGAPSLSLDRLAAVESNWRSDRLEGESGLVHQVAEPIGLRLTSERPITAGVRSTSSTRPGRVDPSYSAAQPEVGTDALLPLALGQGADGQLVLANPGDGEASVEVTLGTQLGGPGVTSTVTVPAGGIGLVPLPRAAVAVVGIRGEVPGLRAAVVATRKLGRVDGVAVVPIVSNARAGAMPAVGYDPRVGT